MAQFLDTKAIIHYINTICKEARRELFIVSPFIQLDANTHERLLDTDERGVAIRFVFGKQVLDRSEEEKLAHLKNLSLYYYRNLHAKCFFNEHLMIIGSMNLYDYSARNREMGVLFQATEDVYRAARAEVESILSASTCIQGPQQWRGNRQRFGHCIRCGQEKEFNPLAPLCYSCYQVWADWGNENYPENYCHRCGKRSNVSKRNPVCVPCLENWYE